MASDYCQDRMKDTTQFLKNLEDNSDRIGDFYGNIVTIDIVNLYDNLRRPFLEISLQEAINKYRPEWTTVFVDWLLDMIFQSLDGVYAKFTNNWYKMIDCVPTGHTLSVHLADIAVFFAFDKPIYSDTTLPIRGKI